MTRRPARRVWAPAGCLLVVLACWEGAVAVGDVPPFVLPAPSRIVAAAVRTGDLVAAHAATTLVEALAGLALGTVAGGVLAVVIGLVPLARDGLYPLLVVTQTVPTIVLAPLLVLWTGFGTTPKVIVVALTVFFPVLVAAVTAWSQVDGSLAAMVRGLGGRERDVTLRVRLPALLPAAWGGVRVGAAYAVGAAVVGEYMAGESGLGVFIQRSRKAFAVDQIFVAVAVVALLTVALFWAVDRTARLLLPWQPPTPNLGGPPA